MFDIGWSELVVIAVVALIAIGPKELPGVLRSVGYWMGKVRQMASEFQGQFQEAMREAEMSDLKKHADDLNSMARGLTSGLNSSALDPYDPLKGAETVTPSAATIADAGAAPVAVGETPASPSGQTPPAEVTPAAEPATSAAGPDYAQVAAMPGIAPPAPEDVVPSPAVPPARRDA